MWTLEILSKIRLSHDMRHVEFGDEVWNLPSSADVREWFKLFRAGWTWSGNPADPHVILHAGDHSNGFFLCKKVLAHGNLREIIAACMIRELKKAGLGKVDGVFGSPQSSILLSGDIGRLLGAKTYVLEKDAKDPEGKRMLFKPDDPVPENHVLLGVEELVTTWSSGGSSTEAMIVGNPYPVKFAPLVGVFVHRPRKIIRDLPDGRRIAPFIELEVTSWPPPDCEPCRLGSPAFKPKGEHAAKFWPQ